MSDRVIAILGATGSGKTTYLRKLLNSHARIFLIDPLRDPQFEKWPVCRDLETAYRLSAARKFCVHMISDSTDTLEGLCYLACKTRKDSIIAIDEIDMFVPSYSAGIEKFKWFKHAVRRGRHYSEDGQGGNVSLVGSSQRIANLHKDFFRLAHRIYLFRTPISDLGGLQTHKELHSAALLPVGQCLEWPPRIVLQS